MSEKKCEFCGGKAGKSELNSTGELCCQGCFLLICDYCVVYGHDSVPRCENCDLKHQEKCRECGGKIKNTNCEYCDIANAGL